MLSTWRERQCRARRGQDGSPRGRAPVCRNRFAGSPLEMCCSHYVDYHRPTDEAYVLYVAPSSSKRTRSQLLHMQCPFPPRAPRKCRRRSEDSTLLPHSQVFHCTDHPLSSVSTIWS